MYGGAPNDVTLKLVLLASNQNDGLKAPRPGSNEKMKSVCALVSVQYSGGAHGWGTLGIPSTSASGICATLAVAQPIHQHAAVTIKAFDIGARQHMTQCKDPTLWVCTALHHTNLYTYHTSLMLWRARVTGDSWRCDDNSAAPGPRAACDLCVGYLRASALECRGGVTAAN